MGSAVGKLAVKNHETLHIPPTNSMDVILAEQARMLVEEMTIKGVGDPEIAAAGDDAGVDPDPGTPNKGEKEPEKEVPTQCHKRPDCAFYMKTGTCKFGPSCKFNHPAKRTKPRVWSKRDGENAQFQKNDMGKKKGPPFKKVDKVELQTSSRRLEQEDSEIAEKMSNEAISEKIGITECKFQKNDMGKQKASPFKKFEQTEKKVDKVELQTSSRRLEQEDSKIAEKMSNETISGKTGIKECKFQKNDMGKQKGPPFKKVEQTEKKVDKVELQTSSRRVEQEDSKIAEKMSNEAISGKTGTTECKFYTTSGGCKYGNSCKYAHFPKNIEVSPIALNFLGLPIRPGKKECPYYMRTGNCKYAVNCWFHHPEPTIANDQQDALPECQIIGSEQHIIPPMLNPARGTFYVPTPLTVASSSYFPEPNRHPQVFPFHSSSECNGYQIHTDESSERKPCRTRVSQVHQK